MSYCHFSHYLSNLDPLGEWERDGIVYGCVHIQTDVVGEAT